SWWSLKSPKSLCYMHIYCMVWSCSRPPFGGGIAVPLGCARVQHSAPPRCRYTRRIQWWIRPYVRLIGSSCVFINVLLMGCYGSISASAKNYSERLLPRPLLCGIFPIGGSTRYSKPTPSNGALSCCNPILLRL